MSRPPDRTNRAGTIRVWNLPKPPPGTGPLDWQLGLRAWFVEADEGVLDVGFTKWYVGAVTLRDIEGVPPAKRHYPEAAYELDCWTIDPRKDVTVDLYDHRIETGDPGGITNILLTPPDIIFQWHGTDDAKAELVAESFVEAILAGISPSRPSWQPDALLFDARWRNRLTSTVEHFTTGHWPMPEARS